MDEAHLRLGGVHVHVDVLGGDAQLEDDDGVAVLRDDTRVGGGDGAAQDEVPHVAAVHVQPGAALRGRPVDAHGREQRVDLHAAAAEGHGHQRLAVGTEQLRGTTRAAAARGAAHERPIVVGHLEVELRADESLAGDGLEAVAELGLDAAQELATRGHVEEQRADGDLGAGRRTRGRHVQQLAALDADACAGLGVPRAGEDLELGHARDARDGLAAEAERRHAKEIVLVQNLAGGVPFEAHHRVGAAHAAAVVYDADEVAPAGLQVHAEGGRPGIERVLDELLHDGRGALDHLARGDLVDQVLFEDADGHDGL